MFKIFFGPSSRKFLKKCEKPLYHQIMDKIEELRINPYPSDMKRIVGRKEKIFRVRVGDYRIQYEIFHDKNDILITDIDKRSRAY